MLKTERCKATMALKRAMADLVETQNTIYRDSGIFYDQYNNLCLEGVACVFGPKDTPYEDCPMFFSFQMPSTYPFDPPKVQFRTYHKGVRFHPNMYVDGKVCLSILHTWNGPPWASTMRISTILVTLQSLMDADPLRHEPGYSVGTNHLTICNAYSNYIAYTCISFILDCIENPTIWPKGFEEFRENFNEHIPVILGRLDKRIQSLTEIEYSNLPYSAAAHFTKADFLERLVKLNLSRITINK
jgi:ubiquitin-protein ligase